MKIALAHKRLDLLGGTERDFYRTAEGLRDLGHDVHLFCADFAVSPPEGTRGHKIPSLALGRAARLLSFAFFAPRAILPHRCDLIVGFGRMVQQDILRSGGGSHRVFLEKMAQGEGILRRFWHRVSVYHRSVLAVERLQYRPGNFRTILAVSREVKRELMMTYHVPERKIVVLYNGVDHERFHPRNRGRSRERVRAQWGIPPEAPVVLFVGSGFKRKGLDRLIAIWKSPALVGIYLLVVGGDAQWKHYSSWAKSQAEGRIVFAGRQSEVEDYYGAADLLVLPAFQEAFGNVILEALASGLPVVTTRAVGAAEILAGELEAGILADADQPSEIEAKILWMLNPKRWPSLSEQARKLGERYSWKNHFQELEGCLLEAVAESRREAVS